jgi:alpha-ketoglutarate-dependent taurine dioxygenase
MTPEAKRRLDEAMAKNPPVAHPVIRTHPVTRREAVLQQLHAHRATIVGDRPV